MNQDTRIVHAGLDPERNFGIVNPPVYRAAPARTRRMLPPRPGTRHTPRSRSAGRPVAIEVPLLDRVHPVYLWRIPGAEGVGPPAPRRSGREV
jgi:hypothetical protein